MKFEEFIGQVQNRLELATQGETVRASRAILTTLGERLSANTAHELAQHLPMEIDRFLLEADSGQEFSYRDFVNRVADFEHEEAPDANYDVQLFIAYLTEFVPSEVIQRIRDELPDEFDRLFEVADREIEAEE